MVAYNMQVFFSKNLWGLELLLIENSGQYF